MGQYTAADLATDTSQQKGQYSMSDLSPTTAQPLADQAHAEITANHGGVRQWLSDLENDLRYGGEQTAVGRALKSVGYQGSSSIGGMEGSAGETINSIPLGLTHAATGVQDALQGKPLQGAKEAASGALQAATIPGSFIAPEASEAVASKISNAIPSAERAGQNFKQVMGAAKDVPIDLKNSQDAILRLVDWQKKTTLGPTVNKFLNRVTAPNKGPLTYEEARDFYQLLGRLSADETMKMAPPVRRDLVNMVANLKTDVGNAAASVGKGQQYYQAMNEFKNAKKMEDLSDATKDIILESLKRAVPYGIGTGIGAYGVKKLVQATQ